MRRWRWVGIGVLVLLLVAWAGYTGYVGFEGSRQLVARTTEPIECGTPMMQFGWDYEAVNYDPADDTKIAGKNVDPERCTYLGVTAGDEIVTDDGVRIAAWYIPAASGAGPTAPTVVLVHGIYAEKAGILKYGIGLHDTFNLVAFDMRNNGQSTGDQATGGLKEQRDLRAVLDWLVATKHPSHIGVLGNSLGAVTALAEAGDDSRVEALAIDSMHTRTRYQIEARLAQASHPAYFANTWAILTGISIRTGGNVESIDAVTTIKDYGTRPLLMIHGDADEEDLPVRTQAFFDDAVALGIPAELHWCPDAGHRAAAGMPAKVCSTDFATWTRDFFTKALMS